MTTLDAKVCGGDISSAYWNNKENSALLIVVCHQWLSDSDTMGSLQYVA